MLYKEYQLFIFKLLLIKYNLNNYVFFNKLCEECIILEENDDEYCVFNYERGKKLDEQYFIELKEAFIYILENIIDNIDILNSFIKEMDDYLDIPKGRLLCV